MQILTFPLRILRWLLAVSCVLALIPTTAFADTPSPLPGAQYSPQQVVEIVIEALKNNDDATDDGIATVFAFASPGNRLNTGPLNRFTQMIKQGFPDMLNHSEARFDPMEIIGEKAVQAVWLITPSGSEVGYAFQLGKQGTGEYTDMWMTEAVVPLGPGSRDGTRI